MQDRTILHYAVASKIGEGGMGEVYLATDTKLDRPVALKFLPESLHRDEEARARLLREARAASKLSHTNIVTIYAVEEFEGRDFIAMEYVDGLIVSDYVEHKKPTLRDLLGIGIGIAQGLQRAHEAGIVHRDLKPGNVIVDRDGKAKILDFGVAKIAGSAKLTETGSTVGTVAYMSPEQTQGSDVDARSDIFSLGAILYELIAGQSAFRGEHKAAVLYAIANETPEPLARYKGDAPHELQRIVTKCLEKDPNNRYQSTADLVTDLKQLRRALTGSSATQTAVTTTTQPVTTGSSRRLLVGGGIAVVLLILALVFKPWNITIESTQEAEAVENRLAVMYFDNLADAEDPERLGEIAANLLITNLSEWSPLDVVSSQRLYDILQELGHESDIHIDRQTASQVARLAQARWMLQGTILQSSPNLVVTAQIVDVATGSAVASQRVDGRSGADVFALVDQLTAEVRADLEIPSGDTADVSLSLAQNMTTSPEAYRHYLDGVKLQYQYRHDQAVESFKKAVALDSAFAMAYHAWALTADQSDPVLARELSQQAMRHIDRASPREQSLIRAFDAAVSNNDPAGALTILTDHVTKYPSDVEGCFARYFAFRGLRQLDSAVVCLEHLIELDPRHKESYNQLAYRYFEQGDFEQAIWAINNYLELAPDEPNPYDSRADLYAKQGLLQEALTYYRQVLEVDPDFYMTRPKLAAMHMYLGHEDSAASYFRQLTNHSDPELRSSARYALANLPAYRGDLVKSRELLEQALAANKLDGIADQFMDIDVGLAYVQRELGDTLGALGVAEEIAKRADSARHWLVGWSTETWIEFLVIAGDLDRARQVLQRLKKLEQQHKDEAPAYALAAEARIAFASDQVDSAVDLLQRVNAIDNDFYSRYLLGRMYLDAGRLADAVDTLEVAARSYSAERLFAPVWQVDVHYYLGRAYETSGWSDRAVEQYKKFLGIWRDADPKLPKTADARARLERLNAAS